MRDLLPPAVAVAVAEPPDWDGQLYAAEAACLGDRVVASRRRDFTAGRVCARRAMAMLGLPPVAVPAGADRSPIWPPGTVGTITHTRGYCAAAVGRGSEIRAVGMDAEQHRELSPEVRRLICLPEEEEQADRLPPGVSWPTVVFSAKETVYKVWHPIVGSWLGFHDALVEVDPATATFTARIAPAQVAAASIAHPPTVITGRFAVDPHLVRTAAALAADLGT
ncbi:4'-phosphopantetheinyl transferase superfamily protein [Micromonospora zingiberis]|uniref:4'-phosphopantetheinyl transferase superfamily protein n=1 Tax=Micromonospora zingiberis TaxID=2053011 RepID=A0A4R0GSH6_9ACTN|nr:4'-phosphopantetheinyl transferase superfamily protein [Micromonospora zingiberis]TCB99977.1 4'-phosphopantetheinyl transferase superfamily protein [Micromonospora zingiberis]